VLTQQFGCFCDSSTIGENCRGTCACCESPPPPSPAPASPPPPCREYRHSVHQYIIGHDTKIVADEYYVAQQCMVMCCDAQKLYPAEFPTGSPCRSFDHRLADGACILSTADETTQPLSNNPGTYDHYGAVGPTCPTYAHSPGYVLQGHDTQSISGVSMAACALACCHAQDIYPSSFPYLQPCISFDYNPTTDQCYLSKEDSVTQNPDYVNSPSFDHYSRNPMPPPAAPPAAPPTCQISDCDNNCVCGYCLKAISSFQCDFYSTQWHSRLDDGSYCDNFIDELAMDSACAAIGECGTNENLGNCARVGADGMQNVYVRSDCGCPTVNGEAALLLESPPPPSPPNHPPPPLSPPLSPAPGSPPPNTPCTNLHEFKDIRGYDVAVYNGIATDWDCFHKLREMGHQYGVRNHNTNVCMAKSQFVDSFNDHATAIDVTCGYAPPLNPPPSPPAAPVEPPSPPAPPQNPPPPLPLLPNQEVQTYNISLSESFEINLGGLDDEATSVYHHQVHDAFRAVIGEVPAGALEFLTTVRNSFAGNTTNVTIEALPGRRLQEAPTGGLATAPLVCETDYAVMDMQITSPNPITRSQIDAVLARIAAQPVTTPDSSFIRCGEQVADYIVERLPMPPPPPPRSIESIGISVAIALGALFTVVFLGCCGYGLWRYRQMFAPKERTPEQEQFLRIPIVQGRRVNAPMGAAKPQGFTLRL
jgi:hypothetical protein